jgi:hypothetical protein
MQKGEIAHNRIDLTGQRFGKLVAIEPVASPTSKSTRCKWLCQCDCGNTTISRGTDLRSGNATSCRCKFRTDLVGLKVGLLTVVKYIYSRKKNPHWICECECGRYPIFSSNSLRKGLISCGCVHRKFRADVPIKMDEDRKRILRIFKGIIDRCEREQNISYHNYGGRGIHMCSEWRNDFKAFYEWAISHGYANNLEVDRIDFNGNYCPENCRWISKTENNRNTRANVFIMYRGERLCIAEACEKAGMKKWYKTVCNRLKMGWDVEKALHTPVRKNSYVRH